MGTRINLASASFTRDVHAGYRRLRSDSPVVYANIGTMQRAYVLTKYDDVTAALSDRDHVRRRGESWRKWLPPNFRPLAETLLNSDPPVHTRLRRLVSKSFTPSIIQAMRPRIHALSVELLSEARGRGELDLVQGFAFALPLTIISDLLGVPEADRLTFTELNREMLTPSGFGFVRMLAATRKVVIYLRELVERRREDPRDDLLSLLAQAEDEGAGLSEDEIVGTAWLLLVAGYETTVGLIANGVAALLAHPEQLQLLRSDLARMPDAIEEMLRYDGPLQAADVVYSTKPATIRGVSIPAGAALLPAVLSANRDADAFPDPDVFDIRRGRSRHLAFGRGIHFCLGAALARLEAEVALSVLLEMSPRLRFAIPGAPIEYETTMLSNRIKRLPVLLD